MVLCCSDCSMGNKVGGSLGIASLYTIWRGAEIRPSAMYVSFPHSRQRHASNSRQLGPIFYGFLGVSDVDKLFNPWRRSL